MLCDKDYNQKVDFKSGGKTAPVFLTHTSMAVILTRMMFWAKVYLGKPYQPFVTCARSSARIEPQTSDLLVGGSNPSGRASIFKGLRAFVVSHIS